MCVSSATELSKVSKNLGRRFNGLDDFERATTTANSVHITNQRIGYTIIRQSKATRYSIRLQRSLIHEAMNPRSPDPEPCQIVRLIENFPHNSEATNPIHFKISSKNFQTEFFLVY